MLMFMSSLPSKSKYLQVGHIMLKISDQAMES